MNTLDLKSMKDYNGITLIALIITIIVTLIIIGISINIAIGNGNLFEKAGYASMVTAQAQSDEKDMISDYEEIITEYLQNGNWPVARLPSTSVTKPYYPQDDFTQVDGTDLNTGLVIKDSLNNEYVWVEVPRTTSVYPTAGLNITEFTDNEYNAIENDLHTYTAVYRDETEFLDEWYDRYGSTVNGTTLNGDKYAAVIYIDSGNSSLTFSNAKTYYGESLYKDIDLTIPAGDSYEYGTIYYAKMTDTFLNDTSGCGLTYENYNNLKKKMLKRIYQKRWLLGWKV